jgi:hypothetical protein
MWGWAKDRKSLIIAAPLAIIPAGCSVSPTRILGGAVTSGHERCPGTDCRAASKKLCIAKGFADGIPVDTQTGYCLEKGVGISDNCVFVVHAVCQ